MCAVKRALCVLFALLLLVGLSPGTAEAVDLVYFTAVNDQLLPLSDETMPFWFGGVLYVPSTALDGNDLGIFYSRSRDRSTVVLYRQRSVITFDLSAGTIDTNSGQSYSGYAITRGDIVFLPLDVVCRFFGLDYSYTRISYGYLVRIKNENVVLSDATFIDAASAPMAQRYNRYVRAKSPEADETTQPVNNTQPEVTAQRTVYFVIESTAAAATEQTMAYLSSGHAAYLFSPEHLRDMDDLLRRLAAGGGAVALRVDASAGADAALAQIAAGNRALWDAANLKTRLVRLDGASEETVQLVAEAGYCPLSYALDYSSGATSVSRMSSRILNTADRSGGSCCVFLGTDETAAASLSALLVSLRAGNCTPAQLNEVTAS